MISGGMRFSSTVATLLLTILATAAWQVAAVATTHGETIIVDETSNESIRVMNGDEWAAGTPFEFVGLWPHGHNRESDAMFFDEEDAKYEQWVVKQREKKQKQMKEKQQGNNKGRAKAANSAHHKPNGPTTSLLTPGAVRVRSNERRSKVRALGRSNVSLFDAAWNAVLDDSDNLRKLLSADHLMKSREGEGDTPEAQYVQLLLSPFAHTVRNLSTESRSDRISPLIYALPFPMILDDGALVAAEQEVRALTADLQVMKETPVPQTSPNSNEGKVQSSVDIDMTRQLIEENLRVAATTVSASKNAHRLVAQLALPIIGHAKDSVSDRLRDVEKQIRNNDESTVAKRQELKDLTKLKKVIKTTKDRIYAADGELRSAYFSSSPTLSKNSFVISLSLICRLRLATLSYVDAIDTIPGIDPFVDVTGSLRMELYSLLIYPFGVGIAVSAAITWVLLAARQFVVRSLKRQGRRSPQQVSSVGSTSKGGSRIVVFALRAVLLLEALCPLFVPLITLYVMISRGLVGGLFYSVLVVVRPQQRLALVVIVVFVLALSVVVSRVVTILDKWSLGRHPTSKRKLH